MVKFENKSQNKQDFIMIVSTWKEIADISKSPAQKNSH